MPTRSAIITGAFWFLAVAVLGLGLLAIGIVVNMTVSIALLCGCALIGIGYARPQVAILLWLSAVVFIPEWTRLTVLGELSLEPATYIGVPVLIGLLVARRGEGHLTAIDYTLSFTLLFIAAQYALGLTYFQITKEAFTVWLLGYIFGREATQPIKSAFVIFMTIVAVWGTIEYALDWHAFANWFPKASHTWNLLQERGGAVRSEAMFGHAIAYGASLAMAIPFAQRFRFGWVIQVLLLAGILVSISRGPMLAGVLTLVLTALFLARGKHRARTTGLSVAGGVAVYLVFSEFVSSSGFDRDTESSTFARSLQLDTYAGSLRVFTSSLDSIVDDTIDNTPLRLAVNFGILTAVLVLLPVIVACTVLLRGPAGPAVVAIVGQIPVLVVTSLITNWSVLIFFLMGMVVSEIGKPRTDHAAVRNPRLFQQT